MSALKSNKIIPYLKNKIVIDSIARPHKISSMANYINSGTSQL